MSDNCFAVSMERGGKQGYFAPFSKNSLMVLGGVECSLRDSCVAMRGKHKGVFYV